jgi:hypothetical protein
MAKKIWSAGRCFQKQFRDDSWTSVDRQSILQSGLFVWGESSFGIAILNFQSTNDIGLVSFFSKISTGYMLFTCLILQLQMVTPTADIPQCHRLVSFQHIALKLSLSHSFT